MRKTILGISILLSACGGGGGSGVSDNMAGYWQGALYVTENTCGSLAADSTNVGITVNQDGNRVVVDSVRQGDGQRINYVGNVTEDGLRASHSQVIPCTRGQRAQLTNTIEIARNGESTHTINLGQCSGGNSVPACKVVRQGLLQR